MDRHRPRAGLSRAGRGHGRTRSQTSRRVDPVTALAPRRLANMVLGECSRDLGLPYLSIWWRDDLRGIWGQVMPTHPRIIQLHTSLLDAEPYQLVDTVAHECKHVALI